MKYKLVPTGQSKQTTNDSSNCQSLTNDQLFEEYDSLRDWLVRHEAKTGTRNLFDVEGRPYNHKLWESKLKRIEAIEDEGRRRGLAGFLSEKELLELLDPSLKEDGDNTPHPTTVSNTKGGIHAV